MNIPQLPDTQPIQPNAESVLITPAQPEKIALWPQWAIVVLLTMMIALSGAQLLGTVVVELFVDLKAALLRILILLPVLIIGIFMLVQEWKKLFVDKSNSTESTAAKD